MCIQWAAEALHEAHCPRPAPRPAAAFTQPSFDDAQQDMQHDAKHLGIVLQKRAAVSTIVLRVARWPHATAFA